MNTPYDSLMMIEPSMGEFDEGRHRIAFRVYYEDTDAGGIVYHANYLRFAERGRTEALRLCGIHQSERFAESGGGFVVGRSSIEYIAPLKLDHVVIVETALQEVRKLRMKMLQTLTCDGRVVARITSDIVMVGANGRAAALPDDILAQLTAHLIVTDQGK